MEGGVTQVHQGEGDHTKGREAHKHWRRIVMVPRVWEEEEEEEE